MKLENLKNAYDPEQFRKFGKEIIDLMADYLGRAQKDEIPVSEYTDPGQELKFWENYQDSGDPIKFYEDVLKRSMHIHHPKYMGHQVSAPLPLSVLGSMVSSLLNNGMAIYEMGAASSALEKVVTDNLCQKLGFENGSGIITSGGSLANLTGLLTARSCMIPENIWEVGPVENYGVLVSSESHYCVDRALRILGFGSSGIQKVQVSRDFKMTVDGLEHAYANATVRGIKIFALVANAPSTSTGKHEDLRAMSKFCKDKNLWLHVDAAHGGAAIYSKKYKRLLDGIEEADSVVIDGHKMMMMPGLMTFLLFKKSKTSYRTFQQKAQYLWEDDQSEEWFNIGKRTLECTKFMASTKFYLCQNYYGEKLFEEYVDHQYSLADKFAERLREQVNIQVATSPECNILCFRYYDPNRSTEDLNRINKNIRETILQENEFYIVQTTLNKKIFLRMTFMNHGTSFRILENFLSRVLQIALEL